MSTTKCFHREIRKILIIFGQKVPWSYEIKHLFLYENNISSHTKHNDSSCVYVQSGLSCSKLTMSLVNVLLNFDH